MTLQTLPLPASFLEVRVHDLGVQPSLTGLCVGFESGQWRSSQFAQHVFEWLPDFALNHSELAALDSGNAVECLRRAARIVYSTNTFANRGEFGELFLHIALRLVFNSQPAISKIYYKTSANDPVKGFDAVHVVGNSDSLELWLGEAKFYNDFASAARQVVEELKAHSQNDYLRSEFMLIRGKIDPGWPHAESLKRLLDERRSLDEIFRRACIAVLLTYDSECLENHVACDAAYIQAFEKEVRANHATFAGNSLPTNLAIHLILLPLKTKAVLVEALDTKLKIWQNI